jgi:hypothetical protein
MLRIRMATWVGALALAACADAGTAPLDEAALLGKGPKLEAANTALDFTAAYVQVPDADVLDLGATFTLEAWIRPHNVAASAYQHVISKWGGGANASYVLQVHAGRLGVGIHDGTVNSVLESTAALVDGAWQHVAATFDHGTLRLYVNGVLDAEMSGAVAPMASTQPLNFGQEHSLGYTGWSYDGIIDEIRIWNVALSERQLARNMAKRLRGTERGLVGYWRFDEGSGAVAYDATPNGLDGALGGAVWTVDAAPVR